MDALSCGTKLEVSALRKSFGEKRVLTDISFSLHDGEFLSVLGPSGCGKTTLLRILLGLLAPDGGNVLRDGISITALAPDKRRIGVVFQNYALFQNMTVLQNVEYALRHNRALRATARETALRTIELVGLSDFLQKKPATLSGGQQQRVAIARTLAMQPDIILFDEPMSALDAATRLALRGEIKRIQALSGTSILYITHDQEEAFVLSDRIMVLQDGYVQQMGTPATLLHSPANDFVRQFFSDNLRQRFDAMRQYMTKEG